MILSHGTAADYWGTPAASGSSIVGGDPLLRAQADARRAADLANTNDWLVPPLEVLVGEGHGNHSTQCQRIRRCRVPLPAGSFRRIKEALLVASPELCFVQSARSLSFGRLVEFGLNLCAGYCIDHFCDSIEPREPVASPESIRAYLERLSGLGGREKALRAARYLQGGAASPFEAKTYALLRLPLQYGGYGISGIRFNYEVEAGRHRIMTEQGRYFIDLCIPELKVGIEYYGEKEHKDVIHDRRRLDALEALGWNMLVIDKQRLFSTDAFERAVLQVAKRAGLRLRRRPEWHAKHAALRHELGLG